MQNKKEREIIFKAVRDAIKKFDYEFITRNEVAREAAEIASRRGINVQSAPYLQDIFMESLDKKEKEGVFNG